MKVHLYISPEPLRFPCEELAAMCGVTIKNPIAIFMMDTDHVGSYGFPVGTCLKCRHLEEKTPGRYHYGLANGEEVKQGG